MPHQTTSIIETLGSSDIIQVFVHDLIHLASFSDLESVLPGHEKYPERSLVLARADDVVCVLNKIDEQYLQFLARLGLGPKCENVIVAKKDDNSNLENLSEALMNNDDALSAIWKRISNNKKIQLHSFISSQEEYKLAAALERVLGRKVSVLKSNLELVQYVNQKTHVRAKAIELRVPVPPGEIVELQRSGRDIGLREIEAAIKRHIFKTGTVILKGSFGFSGSSIVIARNSAESIQSALQQIGQRSDNHTYVIEVMLNVTVSPNILMHIAPDNISCVAITDQLLSSNLVHQGNSYPSTAKTLDDILDSAWILSTWLQKEGYAGLAGFDFGEYFDVQTGKFMHFLADINPRTNAAAYPKSLMEHLNRKQAATGGPPIEAFLSTNVKTSARAFEELQKLYGYLFFDSKVGKGLVPYNTGCLEYGKFTLAALGRSRDEVLQIYEEFAASSTGTP